MRKYTITTRDSKTIVIQAEDIEVKKKFLLFFDVWCDVIRMIPNDIVLDLSSEDVEEPEEPEGNTHWDAAHAKTIIIALLLGVMAGLLAYGATIH